MKTKSIGWLTLFGALSVGGVLLIQFFWLRHAYLVESRTFEHNVHLALKNVVESLCLSEGLDFPAYNPIEQLSGNYFIVRTSQTLQPQTLEYFLAAELTKRNINADFEYGIYDCESQLMVYGNQVSGSGALAVRAGFPTLRDDQYYFGVLFPSRRGFLFGKMEFMLYSSAGLLLIISFFSYATVVMTRQKRLSEIQKDFVNNMTHEFKTPLATIKLSAEVIRSAGNDKLRLFRYASLIEKEAERLQSHVEEVLQIALVEKNRLLLNMQRQVANELLADFANMARQKLAEAGGQWEYREVDKGLIIKVDILHFQNILSNLLDNAIKYNDKTPHTRLTLKRSGQWAVMEFEDNGRGIPKEELRRIFRKFYRLPAGDMQRVKGFGLGLYYVKQVVKVHGGSILASSQPGAGTIFIVKLPIAE